MGGECGRNSICEGKRGDPGAVCGHYDDLEEPGHDGVRRTHLAQRGELHRDLRSR